MFKDISLTTLIILLLFLILLLSDKAITSIVQVVLATIIVSIPAYLVLTYSFNTNFPKILFIKEYLKFYESDYFIYY